MQPLRERSDALCVAAKDMLRRRAEIIALVARGDGQGRGRGHLQRGARAARHRLGAGSSIVEKATARATVRLNPVSFPSKSAHVDLRPARRGRRHRAVELPRRGSVPRDFPALLTGNAVVLKPSEYTPRTSAWFVEQLAARAARRARAGPAGRRATRAPRSSTPGIDALRLHRLAADGPQRARPVRRARHPVEHRDGRQGRGDRPRRLRPGRAPSRGSRTGRSATRARRAAPSRSPTSTSSIADDLRRAPCSAPGRSCASGGQSDVAPLANRRQLDVVVAQVEDARAKGAKRRLRRRARGRGPGLRAHAPRPLRRADAGGRPTRRSGRCSPSCAFRARPRPCAAVNAARYGLGASIWSQRRRARRAPRRAARRGGRQHQQPRLLGRHPGPALERHARDGLRGRQQRPRR